MDTPNPNNEHDYSECAARGICSISPVLSSMHAVILVYMEHLAFYLSELDKLGLSNQKINDEIKSACAAIISNVEFSNDDLNSIIFSLYNYIYESRELYHQICSQKGVKPDYLKSPIKIQKHFDSIEIIKQGQKYFTKKNEIFDEKQKQMFDILIIVLKSYCMYVTELDSLGVDTTAEFRELLEALNLMNFGSVPGKKIEEIVEKYVKLDHELMLKLYRTKKEAFGNIELTEVLVTPRVGKAILVAGNNLKELELLLEATKDRGIDIYTHGQMIMAHALSKFKTYPHLIGHYGKGLEFYHSDFASFPGVVLLTKLSLFKIDSLFSSVIYTCDKIAPHGVSMVKNYNFEPLIKSSLAADGFETLEHPQKIPVGVNEDEYRTKIQEIKQKIEKNEIKHVFSIGVSNKNPVQKKYFEEFIEQMRDDCFALSFSYTNPKKNILYANIDCTFPLFYETFKTIAGEKGLQSLNPTVFYTRCEPHTVPNLFYLKLEGVNNMILDNCSPFLVNPALLQTVKNYLGMKDYSNPKSDFEFFVSTKN